MPIFSTYSEDISLTGDDTILTSSLDGVTKTTHTIKLSTLARFVADAQHPVGSLFFHTTSDDPSTVLGFGTWVRYGKGTVIASVGDTGTFATPNVAVGSETHTMTVDELVPHAHGVYDPGHSHQLRGRNATYPSGAGSASDGNDVEWTAGIENRSGGVLGSGTGIGIYNTGGGSAFSVVQPTTPVYVWKRTA
jgi:hypothetical protein